MRNLQRFLALALSLAMLAVPAFSATRAHALLSDETAAPQSTSALERGYRTGYSDGYQAGINDAAGRAERNFRNKEEYRSADRAYAASYGTLEDYRDGYRQGFEVGYDGGFEHRVFDSTVPTGISRRGEVEDDRVAVNDDAQSDDSSSSSSSSSSNSSGGRVGSVSTQTGQTGVRTSGGSVTIPSNTELRIELLTNLSTDASQKGDPFQARVIEPNEYQGAMIQGHVSRVRRSGRVKGSSELQLSFEQISLNGRWSDFDAQVIEVVSRGGTGVGDVDEEGGVRGTGSSRDTVTKIGTGTAIGAIIGAIAGGGKGAAIGAAIGGAIGTGGAISSRGSDIRLAAGQELRIRTSNTTRIQ
ncbi:MAG TPA: hypothetical protein VGX92_14455 [Pyrinomonadaceae bacterium]|jgi:hypothetical protein|nr:hypothetical protein [Pyrinomonadaceae bacterium]